MNCFSRDNISVSCCNYRTCYTYIILRIQHRIGCVYIAFYIYFTSSIYTCICVRINCTSNRHILCRFKSYIACRRGDFRALGHINIRLLIHDTDGASCLQLIRHLNLIQAAAAIAVIGDAQRALHNITASAYGQCLRILTISTAYGDVTNIGINIYIHKTIALAIQGYVAIDCSCAQCIHVKNKAICCFRNTAADSNAQRSFFCGQATLCQRNTSTCFNVCAICIDDSTILSISSVCNNLQLAIIILRLSLNIATIQCNLLCCDIDTIAAHLHIVLHGEAIASINVCAANLHTAIGEQHIVGCIYIQCAANFEIASTLGEVCHIGNCALRANFTTINGCIASIYLQLIINIQFIATECEIFLRSDCCVVRANLTTINGCIISIKLQCSSCSNTATTLLIIATCSYS